MQNVGFWIGVAEFAVYVAILLIFAIVIGSAIVFWIEENKKDKLSNEEYMVHLLVKLFKSHNLMITPDRQIVKYTKHNYDLFDINAEMAARYIVYGNDQ